MIVVFGSINLDIVTHVPRIPGPGETVLGPSYARVPGGKGANQALAARRAGADVWLVGATGFDEFADAALSLLRADGVNLTGVVRSSLPTGAAFISVDAEGQNAITVAAGANAAVLGSQLEHVPLASGDILMLQREVPDAEGELAARTARARGARIVLNLAPSGVISDSYLSNLDVLIMNEHEAADLASGLGRSGELTELAAYLAQAHRLEHGRDAGRRGSGRLAGWTGTPSARTARHGGRHDGGRGHLRGCVFGRTGGRRRVRRCAAAGRCCGQPCGHPAWRAAEHTRP